MYMGSDPLPFHQRLPVIFSSVNCLATEYCLQSLGLFWLVNYRKVIPMVSLFLHCCLYHSHI